MGGWLAEAAARRLRLWGMDAGDLAAIAKRGSPQEYVAIRAPVSGVVIEKEIVAGGAVAGRPEDLELIAATEDSLWAGAAALAVGAPLHDVGAAVEDSIHASGERAGRVYGIVEDYVGHAIGREMHLDPQIPNYRVHGSSPTVRDTFTGAIEPMVTLGTDQTRVLADGWTVVTVDGTRAAHWEHTITVTRRGLWVLTAADGGEAELDARGLPFGPLAD